MIYLINIFLIAKWHFYTN